jgi:hypothetical protein
MKTMFRPIRQGMLLALVLGCAAPVMAQSRKVDPDNLVHYWILLNTNVQMDAPNTGLNLDKPGCVAVTYTVGSGGIPMNVQVARVVPRSDLGPAARSAVSNFRYGPSLTNHNSDPVATYYVVPFNMPDDSSPDNKAKRQALVDACKLPGYAP